MSLTIRYSGEFLRQAKKLSKRHRSLKKDLQQIAEQLQDNPELGILVAPHIRKVRFAISSKGKGKSGGGRLITYYKKAPEAEDSAITFFLLVTLYDKSDTDTITNKDIRSIIEESELSEEE